MSAEMERPSKKRRLSAVESHSTSGPDLDAEQAAFRESNSSKSLRHSNETISSRHTPPSNPASHAVVPFLTKHLPFSMHAPFGQTQDQSPTLATTREDADSKYCYRHRLDLKCRRQADEPSMDQLQKDIDSLPQDDQQGIAHVWALFAAAPAKQRNLMLQGILSQCCFPQLSFLAARTRELIKIDFMTALPTELAIKVLCFLDTTSLTKAAQVSKNWSRLADDDVVWHKMCEQHIDRKCKKCGWGLPLLERRRLLESKKEMERRAASMALETAQVECEMHPARHAAPPPAPTTKPSGPLTRPWKDVYKDRFRVGCNWKHGRFSTKVLRGHTNGVMALQFDDNILATGSYDSTIKIWDVHTGEMLKTLTGHSLGLRALQLSGDMLISGSLDKTIKIWNWRTGTEIRTISNHTGGVLSLHFVGKIFASGSQDKTIRITNFLTRDSFALHGHSDWVNCVRIDGPSRTLFSASDDGTVRLWDLDTRRTIRTFAGHSAQVQLVMPLPREYDIEEDSHFDDIYSDGHSSVDGSPDPEAAETGPSPEFPALFDESEARAPPPRYMLTGSLDGTMRLWDVKNGRVVRLFFGHVVGIWALAVDTLRIVTGAQDKTVKIWDPRTGSCERTITGHAGPVTCIGLGDSSMFTGSDDGEVRMYSFADSHSASI